MSHLSPNNLEAILWSAPLLLLRKRPKQALQKCCFPGKVLYSTRAFWDSRKVNSGPIPEVCPDLNEILPQTKQTRCPPTLFLLNSPITGGAWRGQVLASDMQSTSITPAHFYEEKIIILSGLHTCFSCLLSVMKSLNYTKYQDFLTPAFQQNIIFDNVQ